MTFFFLFYYQLFNNHKMSDMKKGNRAQNRGQNISLIINFLFCLKIKIFLNVRLFNHLYIFCVNVYYGFKIEWKTGLKWTNWWNVKFMSNKVDLDFFLLLNWLIWNGRERLIERSFFYNNQRLVFLRTYCKVEEFGQISEFWLI